MRFGAFTAKVPSATGYLPKINFSKLLGFVCHYSNLAERTTFVFALYGGNCVTGYSQYFGDHARY
jgi:hypothetical protein